MNVQSLQGLIIVFVLFAYNLGMAQVENTSASTAMTIPQKAKKFSVALSLETYSNMYREVSVDRDAGTEFLFNPSYKVNDLLNVNMKLSLNKQQVSPGETALNNIIFGAGVKGTKFSDELSSTHGISMVLPANKEMQERDRLITSVSLSNGLRYKTSKFQLSYSLGLTKNIHEYQTNAYGGANIEYVLGNTLVSELNLSQKWGFQLVGSFKRAYTYKKFERDAFAFGSDVTYEAREGLSVNFGTSNEGSTLKSNGVDSNIEFFNPNTSILRAGLSWMY